jgi:hypothetical protein
MAYFYLSLLLALASFFLMTKRLRLERNTEEEGREKKMASSSSKREDTGKKKALGAGAAIVGKERLELKTDEQWREKTGLKWPDERPLDEVVLKNGAGVGEEVTTNVLMKLKKQEVFTIAALLGTYDKPDGDAKLLRHGLAEGSAGALMLFIQKVKGERANGK